jgi:fimbrial chaperone protein
MTGRLSTHRMVRTTLVAALVFGALISRASASTYAVNPTQVVLSAQTLSRLVTLRNLSDEPLRFQITVFRWHQSAQGEMTLDPTRDVVIFPSLLTVAVGEGRTIRVGFTGAIGNMEATYRIFVDELPPASPESHPDGGIRMLTRMGIPIFVQPKQPAGRVELSRVELHGSRVSFALRNIGNVHVLPQSISLQGLGRSGAVTVNREEKGWYVLAGGQRDYQFDIPPQTCDGLESLLAKVQIAGATLVERLIAPLQCGR